MFSACMYWGIGVTFPSPETTHPSFLPAIYLNQQAAINIGDAHGILHKMCNVLLEIDGSSGEQQPNVLNKSKLCIIFTIREISTFVRIIIGRFVTDETVGQMPKIHENKG